MLRRPQATEDGFDLEIIYRDGVRRAIAASLEIRKYTEELGSSLPRRPRLFCQIGIASELVSVARALAKKANADEILLDQPTYEAAGDALLVDRLTDPGDALRLRTFLVDRETMARELSAMADGSPNGGLLPRLELALSVLGAVAGLAAWVALVGGLTMWGRFSAAGVPAGEAVSRLPRELLVAEGLRTLAVPLTVGLLAAGLAYLAEQTRAKTLAHDAWAWLRVEGGGRLVTFGQWAAPAAALIILLGIAGFVWWVFAVEAWAAVVIVLVTVAALVGAFAVFAQEWRPAMLVLAAFVLAALWSGTVGFVDEFGADEPRLETADVRLRETDEHVYGLYVASTSDAVLVAQADASKQECGLRVIPADDVGAILIGAPAATGFSGPEQCLAAPGGDAEREDGGDSGGPPVTETATVMSTVTATETVFVPGETVTTTVPAEDEQRLPDGAMQLSNGKVSIPIASVRLPERLQIAKIRFQPNPVTAREPVTATFWIEDTRGYRVRGARVLVVPLRYAQFNRISSVTTRTDGRAVVTIVPTSSLVLGRRGRVVVLVRAWNPNEPILAGVSARRLVQFRVAPQPTNR